MDAFTLLGIGSAKNCERKPRVPNAAVEITRGCQLTLVLDEMFARNDISLSKFKSKKQSCFAAEVNVMHRLQDGLNALVKYNEGNNLNQAIKKE